MKSDLRKKIGWIIGPALLLATLVFPSPEGLSEAAWRTAGLTALMAVFWSLEVIPFATTAFLPIVALPLTGVASIQDASSPYANPVIFLLLGGIFIALAMERSHLPLRIALQILRPLGTRPAAIVAGFLIASALLSMWINNTATAVMMLPVGLSVISLLHRSDTVKASGFAVALMLGLAYGSNIGGFVTLVGTAPNIFFAGFVREIYGYDVGFFEWMILAGPIALVLLPITWWLLVRRLSRSPIDGAAELLAAEKSALGRMSSAERRVAVVFGLTIIFWLCRPLIPVAGLSDTVIAMIGGLLMFVIPAGDGKASMLLDWEGAKRVPWDVLWLLGGGLSLAAAIQGTGLASYIGGLSGQFGAVPLVVLVVVIAGLILLMTELTSNTATTATFLPVVGSIAVGFGMNPVFICALAAIASSGAFMLPVATPPNAIVFGSGWVTVAQMVRVGVWINIAFLAILVLAAATYGNWFFAR